MTSQNKKSYYLLTPVLLVLMGLAIYFIFQLPGEEERQPNVLFITIDSLRYDHLGCTGYKKAHTPHIDALAREGTVFMEAMAQATFTHISLPSMITGKHPAFTGVKAPADDLDSSHTTLAEVLQEQGYLTCGIVGGWKESLYQGFERLEPSGHSTVWKTLLCLKVLDQLDDRPFCIWLYYWDPHASYRPPEKYMKLYEPDYVEASPRAYLDEKNWEKKKTVGAHRDYSGHYNGDIATLVKLNLGEIKLTAMDRAHMINLYDAEIAYVDDEIGKVVAKLKKMKLYDNTLIVLNSDHGEGFGEHKKYYHGSTVYDEMARIPLIIKPPRSRKKNKLVQGQVRNIDIMPTILDYCHLKTPKGCNGQSLRPFIESAVSPNLPSVTETHMGERIHQVGFRNGGHKLIYDFFDEQVYLYDLRTDPGEKNSLLPQAAGIEQTPEEAKDPARQKEQQMRRELMELLHLKQLYDLNVKGKDLREIDEKTRERLKALGYVY